MAYSCGAAMRPAALHSTSSVPRAAFRWETQRRRCRCIASVQPWLAECPESVEPLDDRAGAEAAAAAHRLQAVAAAAALQLVQQRGHQPGAGAAERVAQRDRAAV